jgi:hypothetical protein
MRRLRLFGKYRKSSERSPAARLGMPLGKGLRWSPAPGAAPTGISCAASSAWRGAGWTASQGHEGWHQHAARIVEYLPSCWAAHATLQAVRRWSAADARMMCCARCQHQEASTCAQSSAAPTPREILPGGREGGTSWGVQRGAVPGRTAARTPAPRSPHPAAPCAPAAPAPAAPAPGCTRLRDGTLNAKTRALPVSNLHLLVVACTTNRTAASANGDPGGMGPSSKSRSSAEVIGVRSAAQHAPRDEVSCCRLRSCMLACVSCIVSVDTCTHAFALMPLPLRACALCASVLRHMSLPGEGMMQDAVM